MFSFSFDSLFSTVDFKVSCILSLIDTINNYLVIEFCVIQFRGNCACNFKAAEHVALHWLEITCLITPWIVVHSVLLPLLIKSLDSEDGFTQVAEMSVTNNSSFHDSSQPDDHLNQIMSLLGSNHFLNSINSLNHNNNNNSNNTINDEYTKHDKVVKSMNWK